MIAIRSSETIKLLVRLQKKLSRRRKRSLLLLVPVAILSGLSDVFVVTLVARLFNVVVGVPNKPAIPFADVFTEDPRIKVLGLVILYILSNWIASFLKLFLKGCQYRLKSGIWQDLSELAQHKILAQKYEFFLGRKQSDYATTVLTTISRISDLVVLPLLQLISSLFVVVFLSICVLIIAKTVALTLIICMLICFLTISLSITPFVRFGSKKRIEFEKNTNNILVESIRTIIDVHLTGSEQYFERKYSKAGRNSMPVMWKAEVLPEAPRALVEPFGITLIFGLGMIPILINSSNISDIARTVPFLATIAVASLKLTPPLQDSLKALTSLRAGLPDLKETLKLIELPTERLTLRSKDVPSPKGIEPRTSIRLKNLTYRYPNSKKDVLSDINITIQIGSRVAFVGKTGSGKSTAANQLLALLRPTHGSIELDGVELSDNEVPAWQACCSYVPQTINLLNTNIIENIAYGLEPEKINEDKIWESLEAAQLADLVANMPQGIYTRIGENGIRISGGQRQRLAIARAFYREAKFLVLDEATSALDNKTEAELMNAIEYIGRRCTLVIIAHRLSTVIRADRIYEFDNGRIKASGNFNYLRENSDSFRDMTNIEKGNGEQSQYSKICLS